MLRRHFDAEHTVAVLTDPALAGTMFRLLRLRKECVHMPDKGPGSKGGVKKPKGGGKAAKAGKK